MKNEKQVNTKWISTKFWNDMGNDGDYIHETTG
jgi:hypothetical protein